MLVRSFTLDQGIVFGGEYPTLVLVTQFCGFEKVRLGCQADPEIPILHLDALHALVDEELARHACLKFPVESQEELRAMVAEERRILGEVRAILSAAALDPPALIGALRNPVMQELLYGFHDQSTKDGGKE
ncbi:TPA: hypothetical protein DCL30_02740 [Candidatus Peribacteria bacterium]|nr:MAG: hypothetical protein A3J91_03745 [Candidatus Peribacteria bacterium RIFOXYC2_FULL_58_10]HAI98438.1 hypothetical protein [Candidatus Peribacteria bacterium]HAS34023.1 hypothetical protein [Candidatus Peribacteria bacterium]